MFILTVIQSLGESLRLKQQVIASAVTYFRRFYSKYSLKSIDPFLLAPTTLFLATKVEVSVEPKVKSDKNVAFYSFIFRLNRNSVCNRNRDSLQILQLCLKASILICTQMSIRTKFSTFGNASFTYSKLWYVK
jgi:hypothetical protein